jgi:hypothetical protein
MRILAVSRHGAINDCMHPSPCPFPALVNGVFGLLMFVTGCTRPGPDGIADAHWPAVVTFLQGLTDQCAKEELNVFFHLAGRQGGSNEVRVCLLDDG